MTCVDGSMKNFKGSLLFCAGDTPASALLGGFKESTHSGSTHIEEKGNKLECLLSTSGGTIVATDVIFKLL